MIRALTIAALLTACGGQAGTQDLVAAFDEAGVPLEERTLNDGNTAWSSDSDEDILVEVIEDPLKRAFVWVPAISDDVTDGFPGSRYVEVLDDKLAPGLMDWIEEAAAGRGTGSWEATRQFGSLDVTIENDPSTLGAFTVLVVTEADE